MYNSSLLPPQSLLPALAVRPEPSLLQPLVTRFQQALRLFFLVLVCLLFAVPQASAQVTFFSNQDFSGVESKLNIGNTSDNSLSARPRGIGFRALSMKVPKGMKVEVFFETGFGGASATYCAGNYRTLPHNHDFKGIKSYKILKDDRDAQTIIIGYAIGWRIHMDVTVGSDYNSKWVYGLSRISQGLTRGKYSSNNLLTDVWFKGKSRKIGSNIGSTTYREYKELRPRTITIPPGLLVEIKGDKTLTFPSEGVKDETEIIDLSIYPDLDGKIQEIRVMNPSYVVKSIDMVEDRTYQPNDEKTTVNTINTKNTSSTNPVSIGQQLDFASTASTTNEWSSTRSYSLATGVAVGASVAVEVSGKPAGVGASVTATASIEASVTRSVENSLSKGGSETTQESYTISPSCDVTCPPRTNCEVRVIATQRTKKYKVTTTLIRWDPVNERTIPGTEKIEESTMMVTKCVDASCEPDDQPIPVDLESLTDNEKYAILLKESSLKYKDQYTATKNFISDQELHSKGYIHRTEGKIFSGTYYELLDETEREKLRALNIYAKYTEDTDRYSYITVASSTSINEIVDPKGYSLYSEDGLGYIYKSDPDGTKTVPLILFKSNVGEKYLTTTNPKGKRGYKKVRIEGYVIPK